MLAQHGGKFEAIEMRHADVSQNDRDLGLQQLRQRVSRGRDLDQVLAKILQDRFVGEKLSRGVVHQQDVDRLVWAHDHLRLNGEPKF